MRKDQGSFPNYIGCETGSSNVRGGRSYRGLGAEGLMYAGHALTTAENSLQRRPHDSKSDLLISPLEDD